MIESAAIIPMENGRELSFKTWGEKKGLPVVVHHGTPGSGSLFAPWIKHAESRGLQLISYDRPGYGGSTPDPGRSVADAARDVAAIAEFLGLQRIAVWGASGGGPHSLACAALLPDLVVAGATLASPAPYAAPGLDWLAGMGQDNIEEFGAALEGRDSVAKYIEGQVPALLSSDTEEMVVEMRSLLSPIDAAAFTDDFGDYLLENLRAGIEQRRDGWIDDDQAFIQDWGFDIAEIKIPVLIVHGGQDKFVPLSHSEWLAGHIGTAETSFFPDEGHLSLARYHVAEIDEWLLNKMR
jgi:pimeloyl-ACP methyl ester carboxylesterase